MKRIAAVQKVCCLITGCAVLWFATGAYAIPSMQAEQPDELQPLQYFPVVTLTLNLTEPSLIRIATADSAASHNEDSSTDVEAIPAVDTLDSGLAMSAIPCLIDNEGRFTLTDSCNHGATHKSLSVQFGQRMGTDNSNILGEFDGFRVDYHLTDTLMLNGVAGYPVLSEQDKFNDARHVIGLSANTGKIGNAWDLNSYFIELQDNDEFLRNAGGALRYLRDKNSLLLLFDYDMANSSLDAFTASGALRLLDNTTLSATVDVRTAPLCKRHQAYMLQTMAATDGWAWNPPMDRFTHYTKDLSDEITTLSIGLTHTFSDRLKMIGSAAMLDVTGRSGTGNSTETPSEYFYHLQLSGSELMFFGNSHVLDLRHRITDSMRTSTATLDTHYAINSRWEVSPRLRTDYRDNLLERSVERVTAPSVRMEYRWHDRYDIKIEAGGEWVKRELSNQASSDSSYYVSLGYKASY